MTAADRQSLTTAIQKLESSGFLMKAATAFGAPIEALVRLLPEKTRDSIHDAAQTAIERCFAIAVKSLNGRAPSISFDGLHKVACTATGAMGGFFGLLALPVELPFSTAIILRSIAEIARSEGESLDELEARLACLSVFAFGPPDQRHGDAESGYFTVRAALAKTLPSVADRALPAAFSRFVSVVADRFGVVVSDKVLADAMPIVGAVSGGAVNLLFIRHFQDVAHGHFTIRRLERKYGEEFVLRAYEDESARYRASRP